MPLIKEEYKENILQIIQRNFDNTENAEKSIEDILDKWSKNKEKLYQLFGGQEIISNDILELCNDEEDVQKSFILFKKNLYKYFNNLYTLNVFNKFLNEAVTLEGFRSNKVLDNWEYEGRIGEIKILKGMKFSKAIKFFFTSTGAKNELQNYYSTFSQKMYSKKKGSIKLSICPYDYLSISDNDRGWDSCHSMYDGDYRIGNLNYMADGVTLVAYYITEDDNYDRMNDAFGSIMDWNSKVWRMLVHIEQKDGKIFVLYNKQYPYHSSQFLTEVDNMILKLFENKDFTPLKRYDEEEEQYVCYQTPYTCQYNDTKRPQTFYRFFPSCCSLENFDHFMAIGEPILCLQCGKEIAVETKEGTCDTCTVTDNICGICHLEYDIEDLYYLESEGIYICPDCLEGLYTYCDGCGEYIRKEKIKYKNGKGYCEHCFEEEA